jgi:hypothetical protein
MRVCYAAKGTVHGVERLGDQLRDRQRLVEWKRVTALGLRLVSISG